MHRAVIMAITGHRCLLGGKRGRKAEAPCFTPDSSRGQATCARQFSKYKVFYYLRKAPDYPVLSLFPLVYYNISNHWSAIILIRMSKTH